VYAMLGSRVTVVERAGELLPGADRDLVRPLERRAKEILCDVYLNTSVSELSEQEDEVQVTLKGDVDKADQGL